MNRGVWLSLLVMSMATAAPAETYCVAKDGSDENPGSEAKPLRTIQKAASLAHVGDTILVRGGVYSEPVVLRFSGQEGKPIVLKNYPGERPVIQPGERGEQPPGQGMLLQAQEGYQKPIGWITIEGLEIRYGHDGVKFYNAHDIIIRNCHIHQNWNQGILGNGNRVLIDRNIIAGNGTNKNERQNLMHGIYCTGTAFTITNNLIHSNTAYGIQVAAYDYNKDSMAGPEYAEAKNWLITNNTIAFNKNRAGVVIWQDGVENCVAQNNILYKNGGVNGILFYSQQGRRHLVRNNIFYPPGENLVATEDNAYNAYEAIDNQQTNPRFVNADSFDFHLKAGSPAIDAGSAGRAPKTDFEGKRRPQGGKVDIGAYEFVPHQREPGGAHQSLQVRVPDQRESIPVQLHPANTHYFLWRGKPTLLITSGEHYGAVLNRDFDYRKYLAALESHGFNLTRIFSGVYCEPPGAFNIKQNTLAPAQGRLLCPWARSAMPGYVGGGPKFDLTKWDPEYFDRLRSFVAEAGRRGVVVEVVLFCTFYDDSMWNLSPLNAANNTGSIGDVPRTEVYSGKHAKLRAAQEAMVRKIVDELRDFDNVYYEVCNEPYERPGLTRQWNDRIIAAIADAEAGLEHKHLIAQGIAVRSAKIRDPNPCVSIFNFHAARPESVTLNYGLNKAVTDDETAAFGPPEQIRTEAWQFLLAGGAVFDHLDLSFTIGHEDGTFTGNGPGGGPEFRRQLEILKDFVNSFDFVRMRPDVSIIKSGLPEDGSAQALVDEGRAYAIYLHGGRQAKLVISLPAAMYAAEWVNTNTGRVDRSETFDHAGGDRTLVSPEYENHVALRIRRM